MSKQMEQLSGTVSGWKTDKTLVREFDRPVDIADAIVLTVAEAIDQWSELSDTPPLGHFVDIDCLGGLFKTKAIDDSHQLPSAEFHYQDCPVTILYGPTVRIIVERD